MAKHEGTEGDLLAVFALVGELETDVEVVEPEDVASHPEAVVEAEVVGLFGILTLLQLGIFELEAFVGFLGGEVILLGAFFFDVGEREELLTVLEGEDEGDGELGEFFAFAFLGSKEPLVEAIVEEDAVEFWAFSA